MHILVRILVHTIMIANETSFSSDYEDIVDFGDFIHVWFKTT